MRSHAAHPFALPKRRTDPTPPSNSAPATPPPTREQVTGTTVRSDIDALVQNGRKTANETAIINLIEQWEHGDVKSVGRVSIAIWAALKRYPDQLSAGADRLKDFAEGRGGAGVMREPRLERANRNATKTDEFTWYENIPGHLYVQHEQLMDFLPTNQQQGDEGDCFDLAVIAGTSPGQLRSMMREEAPLSDILKFAEKHEVLNVGVLRDQMKRVKNDGAEEPKLFLVRYFRKDPTAKGGAREVWVPVDHEFPVGVDHKLKFASTKDGALWLPVIEKAHALFKGAWKSIDGGYSRDSMFDHFGIEGKDFTIAKDLKDDQQLYDLIRKSLSENRVVTSGTFSAPSPDPAKTKHKLGRGLLPKAPVPHVDHPMPNGIIDSHEYTVLGVVTTKDPSTGEVTRWIKLRNPWGDSIPAADPNAPDTGTQDAGVFFMKFSVYRQAFEDLTIQQFAGDPKPKPAKKKK